MTLPWYKDGLKFKCTGCGKCCSGPSGAVWVDDEDILRLARKLNLAPEDFVRRHVRRIGERLALKEVQRGKNFDCVFLEGKLCGVYEARPVQCRVFPWWPQNLESQEAWDDEGKRCEGINHPDAPVIALNEIEAALK